MESKELRGNMLLNGPSGLNDLKKKVLLLCMDKQKVGDFSSITFMARDIWKTPVLAPGGDTILSSSFWESVHPTEDLTYVEHTLKDVLFRYRFIVDPRRIYAVGFSSGNFLLQV